MDQARRSRLVNDLLLSGSADVVAAGPPAFLTLWHRPNTRQRRGQEHGVRELDPHVSQHAQRTCGQSAIWPTDKIAIAAVKVSFPRSSCRWRRSRILAPPIYAHYDK